MRTRVKPKKEKEEEKYQAPLLIYPSGEIGEIALQESQKDCFEYRWSSIINVNSEYDTNRSEDVSSGQWELFNCRTGETIVEDEHNDPSLLDTITRVYSLWSDTEISAYYEENHPVKNTLVSHVLLLALLFILLLLLFTHDHGISNL